MKWDRRARLRSAAVALALPLALTLGDPAIADEQLYYDDRSEIPEAYRWNLKLYFADASAWEEAFAEAEAMLPTMESHKGKVASSPKAMAAALEAQFALYRAMQPLYVNANQKLHTDRSNSLAEAQAGRAEGLYARIATATAFVNPEIVALAPKLTQQYRDAKALQPYLQHLDNLWRLRAHSRSAEVEEVIAGSSLPGAGHRNAYDALNFADIEWPSIKDENGEEVVLSPGQFGRFQSSTDRDLRQRSYEVHLTAVGKYKNTFAAALGSKIQRDVWLANVYRYPSAVEAALSSTNVPAEVMETLLATVHDNVDAIQDYADLRRRILGYKELQPWDRHVSLLPGSGQQYTFDEGWQLAMQFWTETFGEEFADIAQQALDERWVDVYSSEGKQAGAYSWGAYQAPRYLLLNWKGNFDSVSTLVHEMGHSVHGVLAGKNQSYHDAGTDTFVAEVGSVASESLFGEWMLERTKDPEERKLLIDHALTSLRNTFVTQIFFHEWEAKVHAMAEAKEALTAEALGQAYADLHALYNGDSMVPNELTAVTWARVSHFYRNFYVWKYATSFAAGEALAARFRSGDKSAAEDYLAMLKLGGSQYPLDVLKAGGVDMTDPAVIRAVMDRFRELQLQLAREFGL